MTTQSSKSFLVLLSLVLIFLVAALVFGLYDIKTKNKEVSRIINDVDESAKTEELVQSIKEIQTAAAEDLETFESLVFTDGDLVPFIENIEEVGEKLSLETKIVSVNEIASKKPDEPNLIRLTIETVEGSWPATLSFLRAIESLPYRVMIDESTLSKDTNGWRLRMTISVHAFN